MKLPSNNILEISNNKIDKYLLNPNHPDGQAKADFYIANGIDIKNTAHFENLLKQQATENDIIQKIATPYGTKYIFESAIAFPNGKSHVIRSVWISAENEKILKFVTAYKI